MTSPGGPASAAEFGGEDYPLDGFAPDDLPARDVRGDEDEEFSSGGVGAELLGEPDQVQADARATGEGGPEVIGAASEAFASPSAPDDHPPMLEAHAPVLQVEVDTAELPAQLLLPGLEPSPDDAPQRLTRPKRAARASSDRRALRMAQIELWPQPESADPEA